MLASFADAESTAEETAVDCQTIKAVSEKRAVHFTIAHPRIGSYRHRWRTLDKARRACLA